MYVNLKSEERISVPRFLNLLPQKCSQHIDELAVGRWFGKCSSRNMFQEAPIRLLPAAPDKRSQIPLNRGRRNAKFPGCFPIEPFGNEPDALWVLSDLFHHIGSTGKSRQLSAGSQAAQQALCIHRLLHRFGVLLRYVIDKGH